jgi:hypothetical protein
MKYHISKWPYEDSYCGMDYENNFKIMDVYVKLFNKKGYDICKICMKGFIKEFSNRLRFILTMQIDKEPTH